MKKNRPSKKTDEKILYPTSVQRQNPHADIITPTQDPDKCLDGIQLYQLEQSFREWVNATLRRDIQLSRKRILFVFLLIRHTGAKLNEVLGLDPFQDIDFDKQTICFGRIQGKPQRQCRIVPLPRILCIEIKAMASDLSFKAVLQNKPFMDPGFVRRKFYERAHACGIAKQLGAPEILRKSRAVELMQNNLPLPAVQMMLGHSTPNLTSAYVSFSQDDILQTVRRFMDRESIRKTSARNSFFGKIQTLITGDIQTRIELLTMGGNTIVTVITNDSVHRLGLKPGKLITAEVKAPWVLLEKSHSSPECSADNRFHGIVERVVTGKINTEYIVGIPDGTKICSITTTESSRRFSLNPGDTVWAVFNSFSVILLS